MTPHQKRLQRVWIVMCRLRKGNKRAQWTPSTNTFAVRKDAMEFIEDLNNPGAAFEYKVQSYVPEEK